MTLEELLEKLKELEYASNICGRTEYFPVINSKNFSDVENLIRQYALDHHDTEMGELKAKLYVYEKIIANSNFAPLIKEKSIDIPATRY